MGFYVLCKASSEAVGDELLKLFRRPYIVPGDEVALSPGCPVRTIRVIPAIVLASGVTTPPGSNYTNVILRYKSGEVHSIRYLGTGLRFLMQEAGYRAGFLLISSHALTINA